jgi:putative tricarboxylic transport membrane protein
MAMPRLREAAAQNNGSAWRKHPVPVHTTAGRLARRAVAAAALSVTLAAAAQAEIDGVEIIAPAGPGGGYDQLARATQEVLEADGLASNVQVINVPGAGGTIGLAQFVTGRGGDNDLLVTGLGMIGAIKVNNAPVTLEQVAPLARLTGEYQPLVVAADSPIKTLDDLAAIYKADPGSVSWGGFALGSPDHLVSAMTVKAMGGDVTEMNYIVAGAGGEMIAQVMGGHITVATGGLNEFAGLIETGKLRALAISSPERLPGVDIPTFKEQGYDVELVNWRGLMAKADASEEDLKALDAAISDMVASEAWQTLSKERGWVDMHLSSADFAAFLETEQPRIEAILAELGLAN